MKRDSYQIVKLSDAQRRRKREVDTQHSNRRNRPHGYYKCFSYLQKPIYMQKFGYGYETNNKVLAQLKDSFEAKCDLYFNKMREVKLSSYQKMQLKERIDFKPVYNPILAMFNTLDRQLVKNVLTDGFCAIQQVSNQQRIIKQNRSNTRSRRN